MSNESIESIVTEVMTISPVRETRDVTHMPGGMKDIPRLPVRNLKTSAAAVMERRCPNGYVTRELLAQRTRLTPKRLQAILKAGGIKPDLRNARGEPLFKVEWVEKILELKDSFKEKRKPSEAHKRFSPAIRRKKMPYTTDQYNEVIRLYRVEKVNPAEIPLKALIHPSVIFTILRDWALAQGGIWIPGDVMEVLNKVPLEGTFPITDAQGIAELIMAACREIECVRCHTKRRSKLCRGCSQTDTSNSHEPEKSSAAETAADSNS